MSYILAIDAGTTGIRLLLYDQQAEVVRQAYSEFSQIYPKPGWVEHDANEIWQVTQALIKDILTDLDPASVVGIGLANQRETTVLWDAETGQALHNAIVWQCRRTAYQCQALAGSAEIIRNKTGLFLDAYFSAPKISWLLANCPEAQASQAAGRVRFGTIDTWLLYCLSGGKIHATDPSNASRTMLFDIHERRWDSELCRLFGVPESCLPQVSTSSSQVFGVTAADIFGAEVPLAAAVGDQQAALFGQACVEPGSSKNTYGTGCFALVNAGPERCEPKHGLLLTLAYDAGASVVYAHEGSVFVAGALIQWLRDELGLLESAQQSEELALSVEDNGGVMIVPAFSGLGAPYWDPDARGAILGLTRGSNRGHIVRAALEAICFQTYDLMAALGGQIRELRVDGGGAANDFLMQCQADLLGVPVIRPANRETTAQGAAFLAGLATGFWQDFAQIRGTQSVERRFEPVLDSSERDSKLAQWRAAIARVRRQ